MCSIQSIPSKYFVTFFDNFDDYGRILRLLKFCGKIITSPMFFFYRKSLIKIDFGQNFFNCQPISKMFAAHFRTNKAPDSAKKIVCQQLNEIEDIHELPLLESRNYTLITEFHSVL